MATSLTNLTKPLKRQRRPQPYRCTRPDWGARIGWWVIAVSVAYLSARIVPALFFGGQPNG